MKVPKKLRRIIALAAAALIALGSLAFISAQAMAEDAPISKSENDWN